jgi:hypothetical protein
VTSPLPYVAAEVRPTEQQLAGWTVEWQELHASGKCPRCTDEITYDWELDHTALSGGSGGQSVTRKVTCLCETAHPGTPDGKKGCGATMPLRFYLDATGAHAAPQTDPRLVAAARALDAAGADAEKRLRTAAEKWVAGVAAVLALFGIAGTVAGGSILGNLSGDHRRTVVGLTAAAIVAAILAIVSSYLAAYGWPRVVEMTDNNLLTWYEGRRNRLRTIASQLRWAVIAAVASIGLLTSAAGLAWLTLPGPPDTILKLTDRNDATTCGTLLPPKTSATVRLRLADGSVKETPLTTVLKVESVKSC